MYCNKCGHVIYDNHKYCTNCGNFIKDKANVTNTAVEPAIVNKEKKSSKIKINFIDIIIVILFFSLITIFFLKKGNDYYLLELDAVVEENISGKTTVDASKFVTSYIGDEKTYKEEIKKISNSIKEKCPKLTTLDYEDEIINRYGLYSANLCELSDDYLTNLLKIYEYASNEYPYIFDYAFSSQMLYDANSKFSIVNGYSNAIALYGIFDSFSNESGTNNRLGMLLNTTYFLDEQYFSEIMIKQSNSGHFPTNATIYSPVIHELGHKLHYDLTFKKYGVANYSIVNNLNYAKAIKIYDDLNNDRTTNEIVKKAIKNLYKVDTNKIEEYTEKISKYAKVNSNEAIAESVHDYYLNKENANELSIEIVKVLKEERNKYFR